MASLYNKNRGDAPPGAVYIGRGSPFGNPFKIEPGIRTRAMAVAQFREHLARDEDLRRRVRSELRGRDLVCFCKPKPCHGDALLELANADEAPSNTIPTNNPTRGDN